MATYTRPGVTPNTGDVIEVSHLNTPLDHLYNTILNGGITHDQLATGAVTGTKVADGSITTQKFTAGSFLNEDNMSSNSTTAVASQASIKAYVEARAGILENRTTDPAGPAVGQMWLRIDL